eukprot:8201910-Pyramimonas_sp.AAC.1
MTRREGRKEVVWRRAGALRKRGREGGRRRAHRPAAWLGARRRPGGSPTLPLFPPLRCALLALPPPVPAWPPPPPRPSSPPTLVGSMFGDVRHGTTV